MPSFWFPDLLTSILRTFAGWGIRLYGATSGAVGLLPPAVAGSTDYVLPGSAPGADGYALICTQAGVMSWGSFDAAGAATAAAATVQANLTTHAALTTSAHGGIVASATLGAANGVATLDSGSHLTASQIPATVALLAGATFSGDIGFSGTDHAGLVISSLTTTQRNALTPSNGMVIYNTTTNRLEAYSNGSWREYVRLDGDTMTGDLAFSGTGHAGLVVNSLTTTQRDALTPSAGMIVYNTTTGRFESYNGSTWVQHVRVSGDTMTGQLIVSAAAAASTPPVQLTGAIFTGGTGTTTFPHLFIQPASATAVTNWSTSGTCFGVNAASGFAGNFIDCKTNGGSTSAFLVNSGGTIAATGRFTTSVGVGASTAAITLTGLIFTGGSGTTTFPAIFVQRTGVTAVTAWSTSGTYFGVNADSGFAGNFIDVHVNGGASVFSVSSAGNVSANNVTAAGSLITATQTPASASAAGVAGTITWDASFIYVCVATNTWKRVAISTW